MISNKKIQIKNLSFEFKKGSTILDDIDLNIEHGGFLSILGASGSGKSTLLRIISNILPISKKKKPNREISIFGKSPKEYIDTGKLSFMFQEANLMPNLNVRDNIGFPLKLRGLPIDKNLINELLEVVGLTEHQNKYPSELSGGMKTRVSLARGFVTKPELLLLDEPFSALDISWKYDLYKFLQEFIVKFKTTVLLVTHDIQESIILGDQIVVLSKKGKILRAVTPTKEKEKLYDYNSISKIIEDNINIFLSVQKEILIDGVRTSSTLDEVLLTINYLEEVINSKKENDRYVFAKIQSVKSFVNDPIVYSRLLDLWNKSNNYEFKEQLMWRILDNENTTKEIHKSCFELIKNNWSKFVRNSKEEQYFRNSEVIERTISRMNNKDYPDTKNWLYLTYLRAMAEKEEELQNKVNSFFKTYIADNPNLPNIELFQYIERQII